MNMSMDKSIALNRTEVTRSPQVEKCKNFHGQNFPRTKFSRTKFSRTKFSTDKIFTDKIFNFEKRCNFPNFQLSEALAWWHGLRWPKRPLQITESRSESFWDVLGPEIEGCAPEKYFARKFGIFPFACNVPCILPHLESIGPSRA